MSPYHTTVPTTDGLYMDDDGDVWELADGEWSFPYDADLRAADRIDPFNPAEYLPFKAIEQ